MSAAARAAALLVPLAAAAMIAPVVASGEGVASDGANVLRVSASAARARHRGQDGRRRMAVGLRVELARIDGGRPLGFSGLRFELPLGAHFDPGAVPRCREAALTRDGVVAVDNCPAGATIGAGTALIDARPILPERVPADVTLVNGLEQYDDHGARLARPRPAIFFVTQALDVQVLYAGTFARDHRRVDVSLGGTVSSPEPFTITGLRLRIRAVGTDARPFLRAPSTCVSAWTFSVSYLFDAPLTARDRLPCPALHGPT